MKKIALCVGTRPNFIKITQFEKHILSCKDISIDLVHTGQHFDENMSTVFFQELGLRKPDFYLNAKGDHQIEVITDIMVKFQNYIEANRPDFILVPGDVNSSLACAFVANRNNIPLGHIESGLRSFDRSMPEEINRILIDDLSDLFFVTEQSGIDNLVAEGKNKNQIHFVGNTMIDTLLAFQKEIDQNTVLSRLGINESYGTLTFHRPSNVDNPDQLTTLVDTIVEISKRIKLVFTVHPRTLQNLKKFHLYDLLDGNENIKIVGALGYFDFMKLVKNSSFILTDSGGIQEESSFLNIPCLTVRENTERPITLTNGSNELIALNKNHILYKIDQLIQVSKPPRNFNEIPFWDGRSTERIVEVLCKYLTKVN